MKMDLDRAQLIELISIRNVTKKRIEEYQQNLRELSEAIAKKKQPEEPGRK